MSDPAIVRKWLPRRVRRTIENYRPEYFWAKTYSTDTGVWIERSKYEIETWVSLTFEFGRVRIIEYSNSKFQNAASDWPELAEVAAWAIQLDDSNHIALAKQVASELPSLSSSLFLQHDKCKCTSYRMKNAQFHLLQQIPFS